MDLVIALDVPEEVGVLLVVLQAGAVVPGVHEGLGGHRLAVAELPAVLEGDREVLRVRGLDLVGEHVLGGAGLRVVPLQPAEDHVQDLAALHLVGVRRFERVLRVSPGGADRAGAVAAAAVTSSAPAGGRREGDRHRTCGPPGVCGSTHGVPPRECAVPPGPGSGVRIRCVVPVVPLRPNIFPFVPYRTFTPPFRVAVWAERIAAGPAERSVPDGASEDLAAPRSDRRRPDRRRTTQRIVKISPKDLEDRRNGSPRFDAEPFVSAHEMYAFRDSAVRLSNSLPDSRSWAEPDTERPRCATRVVTLRSSKGKKGKEKPKGDRDFIDLA